MSAGIQQGLKSKWANTIKNKDIYNRFNIIEYGKIPNSSHVRFKRSKNG